MTGGLLGTAGYLAPEMVAISDARVDAVRSFPMPRPMPAFNCSFGARSAALTLRPSPGGHLPGGHFPPSPCSAVWMCTLTASL